MKTSCRHAPSFPDRALLWSNTPNIHVWILLGSVRVKKKRKEAVGDGTMIRKCCFNGTMIALCRCSQVMCVSHVVGGHVKWFDLEAQCHSKPTQNDSGENKLRIQL